MPVVYRRITKRLCDRLAEIELCYDKSLSLREEFYLTRATADESIRLFSEVYEMNDKLQEILQQMPEDDPQRVAVEEKAKKVSHAVIAAGKSLRETMKEVRDAAIDVLKVEQAAGPISPVVIRSILAQTAALMYEVCGDSNEHLANEYERLINERITVDVVVKGTTLTPDQDVREMDATVPRLEKIVG